MGRPTEFRPEYTQIAADFHSRGYSDAKLAHLLRVGAAMLVGWKREYPEFAQALEPDKARVPQSVPPGPVMPTSASAHSRSYGAWGWGRQRGFE